VRARTGVVLLVCLLAAISCADMPVAPRAMVHVDGQVLDREGAPIVNAWLSLIAIDPLPENRAKGRPVTLPNARTDSHGHFRLDLPEASYKVDVQPQGYQGYPDLHIKPLVITRNTPNPILRYEGVYLRGRVVGPTGEELTYVNATALSSSGGSSVYYEGAAPFRLLLLPGSEYRLRIGGTYSSGLPSMDTTIVVGAQDDSLLVSLTGHYVHVHATTNHGTPLAGTRVYAQSLATYALVGGFTDLNGDVTLFLRAGNYQVIVEPEVYGMVPWSFAETIQGDQSLAYDLTPVRLTGTVRSSADQTPIPDTQISIHDSSGLFSQGSFARTDADGSFAFLVRPGTTYALQADATGFASFSGDLSLEADSTLDVVLTPYPGFAAVRPAPPAGPGIPGRGSSGR
jgi:carboxypeptidase family protein